MNLTCLLKLDTQIVWGKKGKEVGREGRGRERKRNNHLYDVVQQTLKIKPHRNLKNEFIGKEMQGIYQKQSGVSQS